MPSPLTPVEALSYFKRNYPLTVAFDAGLQKSLAIARAQAAVCEAVIGIIDSLDDPYKGRTWAECSKGQCSRELERIRAALVPTVDAYLTAINATEKGDGDA